MNPYPSEEPGETESEEAEIPGAWLFGLLADIGLMGPEVEEETLSDAEEQQSS